MFAEYPDKQTGMGKSIRILLTLIFSLMAYTDGGERRGNDLMNLAGMQTPILEMSHAGWRKCLFG